MNILYHNKTFIVHYSPPASPLIGDENTVQAALEGIKSVRALTTAGTFTRVLRAALPAFICATLRRRSR